MLLLLIKTVLVEPRGKFKDTTVTAIQWRRKLEIFEGDGDEKIGVKGGYPLENSSFF